MKMPKNINLPCQGNIIGGFRPVFNTLNHKQKPF